MHVAAVSSQIEMTEWASVDVAAPDIAGYQFLTWITFATNSWCGSLYASDPLNRIGRIWVSSVAGGDKAGQDGKITCYALYVRS